MAKQFVLGQLVRVNTDKPHYGAQLREGDESHIIEIDLQETCPNIGVQLASGVRQWLHPDDLDIIQTAIPVVIPKEEKKVTTAETAIPKTDIKTIYTVVQDGETIGVYIDRDVAREVKADMGGRAAGAEILQFKPAKTIR